MDRFDASAAASCSSDDSSSSVRHLSDLPMFTSKVFRWSTGTSEPLSVAIALRRSFLNRVGVSRE